MGNTGSRIQTRRGCIFLPTGRTLKTGQGFFADIYALFPGFAYGVTDNIAIGGGMSLVPGVGIGDQIFYFTPKIGLVASETINFAVGALIRKCLKYLHNTNTILIFSKEITAGSTPFVI